MLTDKQISNLKEEAKGRRRIVMDSTAYGSGALGVRVGGRGKTFIYRYTHKGRSRIATLGRYPTLTLAQARVKAAEMAVAVEAGKDPAVALVEDRQRRREMPTIKDLADEYIERWARPRKKSWETDRRVLDLNVIPAWGAWDADEVRRRDVRALLDKVADRAPVQANRVLEIIRKMFNWAIENEIIEINPCWQVRRPTKEKARDRVLSDDEIRIVWAVLGREYGDGLEPDLPPLWPGRRVRLALRMALVTAQRRAEIAEAAQDEFDLDGGWWTIPASRSKNGLAHRVPLSALAVDIISEVMDAGGDWLLPSPRGSRPIRAHALSTAVARVRQIAGIPPWRGHDLRRTAASGMASAGVPRLVIGQVLNHAETGVTAVYDRHSYDQEKRRALDLWCDRLCEIVSI